MKWKKNKTRRNNQQQGWRITTDRERDGQISKANRVSEKSPPKRREIEKEKKQQQLPTHTYIHTYTRTSACKHTHIRKKKGRIESSARIHIIKYIIHIIRKRGRTFVCRVRIPIHYIVAVLLIWFVFYTHIKYIVLLAAFRDIFIQCKKQPQHYFIYLFSLRLIVWLCV